MENEQELAEKWWKELHPLNKRFFSAHPKVPPSVILRFYRENEQNNPANKSKQDKPCKK